MIKIGLTEKIRSSHRIPWFFGLGYVLCFLALDWASYIHPLQGLNITPWNPQPAVAVALLLLNRRWLWVVWVGLIAAELIVRGIPFDWMVLLMSSAALSLIYAAIAHSLTTRLDRTLTLATQMDLLWFTGIVLTGAFLNGIVYIFTISAAGFGPTGPIYLAVASYWIGDAVGLLVMLPLLLLLIDPIRRTTLLETLKDQHSWVVFVLVCFLLWVVFGQDAQDQFKYFYLLLLPVVWLSSKLGVPGAVVAASITQLGLILALQFATKENSAVFELQVLMAAVTMTGLFLGVAVDERTRATVELQGSLRMAAAGQMSAALAHELSQPLTALNNYAQACQMIVNHNGEIHQDQREQLIQVTQRMVADAIRAGSVIKRLRDFFGTGSTNLEAVTPEKIVNEVFEAHKRQADLLKIRMECQLQKDLPSIMIDPVQISVVLRNLLNNAIDSASVTKNGAFVKISAYVADGELLIEVQDNGPGVDPVRLRNIFEAGSSVKPGGMGVGLSICRAIVEAHGGKLWSEQSMGGCFRFTIPVKIDGYSSSQNA